MKIGDKVIMNDKYVVVGKNKGKVFIVCSEPWDVCGTECVLLEDYRGAYAVDGLTVVNGAIISAAGTIISDVSLVEFSR